MRSRRRLVPTLMLLSALAAVASTGLVATAHDDHVHAPATQKADAFAKLQALAGKWVMPADEAAGREAIDIEFRVVAMGGSVVETMFPGQPHEMVNVYTRDGDGIIVTHYCAGGNAPRMKLVHAEGDKLEFDFLDGANLKPDSGYMGKLTIELAGDRLVERWMLIKEGKVSPYMTFELQRAG